RSSTPKGSREPVPVTSLAAVTFRLADRSRGERVPAPKECGLGSRVVWVGRYTFVRFRAFRCTCLCNSAPGWALLATSRSRLITPRLTVGILTLDAQRSGPITAEVGGSSPPRPTAGLVQPVCLAT